jgi:nucleoside-diphosphate-sugar epimerase
MTAVAVTGSNGFVGARLVGRLVSRGVRVHALVRPESRAQRPLPEGAERHVLPTAPRELEALLARLAPRVIVNLATYGVAPQETDWETMLDANLGFLTRLLVACEKTSIRVVHTGSCSEYARIEKPERASEDTPCHPSTPYGAAKLAATEWGRALAERIDVPFVTLRLFGVYGPGESPHRIIPAVSTRLRRGENVPLSPGAQVRDLSYVDDVADALIRATELELPNGAVYNVCSGRGVSIREVSLRVAEALGASPDRLIFGAYEMRPGEQDWLVGDETRYEAVSGWKATTTLEQGIELTLRASAEAAA